MMKVNRKNCTLFSFVLLLFLCLNASATFILPVSSYAEAEGAWQGSSLYEEDNFSVLVEFAVYDSDNLQYTDETSLVDEFGLDGQYVYAYQLFNTNQEGYDVIAYFGLLDSLGASLDGSLTYGDSTAYDDSAYNSGDGGVAPTPVDSETEFVWIWTFDGGYVAQSEHSWFLVFSSDYEPVAGDYEIRGPETPDNPVPGVPEPAMVVLFGVGSVSLFLKRRRLA
jgi:hypothetical protein